MNRILFLILLLASSVAFAQKSDRILITTNAAQVLGSVARGNLVVTNGTIYVNGGSVIVNGVAVYPSSNPSNYIALTSLSGVSPIQFSGGVISYSNSAVSSASCTNCAVWWDAQGVVTQMLSMAEGASGGGGASTNAPYLLGSPTLNDDLSAELIQPDASYGSEFRSTTNAMDDEFPSGATDMTKWTWWNQHGRTVTNINGALWMITTNTPNFNTGGIVQTLPSPPYAFRILYYQFDIVANYQRGGIFIGDSATSRMVNFVYGVLGTRYGQGVELCTTNAYSSQTDLTLATPSGVSSSLSPIPIFLQISDDGTNFSFSTSTDGQTFRTQHTASRTAWLATPDRVGVFIEPHAGGAFTNVIRWFRRVQ